MRACGICGSDAFYIARGGIPPREGATPIGHEPAGEVVRGRRPTSPASTVGDHVVINPIASRIRAHRQRRPAGCPLGVPPHRGRRARHGHLAHHRPTHVPCEVAALNEPMAVARHAVNRTSAEGRRQGRRLRRRPDRSRGGDRLQAQRSLQRRRGRRHSRRGSRRHSRSERMPSSTPPRRTSYARLIELHGAGATAMGAPRAGTDIYLDAAGVPARASTRRSRLQSRTRPSASSRVHKHPVPHRLPGDPRVAR